MKTARIPKGNGKFRVVYCPSNEEKAIYKSYMGDINRRVEQLPTADCIHGFMRHKSPVTMAMAHVGHAWTITMDLKDFFPSCTRERLKGKIKGKILDAVLVDNHAAQGLPTSPALANLAASDMDKAILRMLKRKNKRCVYTRYADDIAISGDNIDIIDTIINDVKKIASKCGWTIHPQKTHVYHASKGRRIICGVSVGEFDIQPTRKMKRKLRAAKHKSDLEIHGAYNSFMGLGEWCKLKTPKPAPKKCVIFQSDSDVLTEVKSVCEAWNLKRVDISKVQSSGEIIKVGDNAVIVDDPVLMLGMSTYTTGWVSCMRHPHGQYRRGTIFWTHLRGTRIATIFDDKKGMHGGVERPLMKARALIHELRDNGVMVYDKFYGSPDQIEILKNELKKFGALSVSEARKKYPGAKVVGHAPVKHKPYFDSMKSSTTKAKTGQWRGKKVRVVHL
jgi:hypothetical protein